VAFAVAKFEARIWICHGEWRLKDEDEGRSLPQRSAFLYDAKTREKWRGNRIYQALTSKAVDELILQDYRSLYLMVNDHDSAAQRAPERLGFRPVEQYVRLYCFLRVFRFRRDSVAFLGGC
jgi:ribosomal protein S18 acetylase RimI-like enzyme